MIALENVICKIYLQRSQENESTKIHFPRLIEVIAVLQGWMGSSMLRYFTLPYMPPVEQQWRNFYNAESSSATYVNEKADVVNKSYLCCYHRRNISSCHQLGLHSSL